MFLNLRGCSWWHWCLWWSFATWTPWSTFATCHHICDHLSLLGPIGHFRYLWSTVSTSNLSRHGMPSCGWWDTHLCPKAAFPSQGGKDPPLRPIPWQGQGQGVITFGPKTFARRHRIQAKGKGPPSIPSVESIALHPLPWQRQGQGVITFGPKTFALRHRIQAKGKDPHRFHTVESIELHPIPLV